MFGRKNVPVKAVVNSSTLTSDIEGIVSAITNAVSKLENVGTKADTEITATEDAIKKLEAEKAALVTAKERANSIREKLSALLG